MRVRVSLAVGGMTAEVLDDLSPEAAPDELRDMVRRHTAALRAGLGDVEPPTSGPADGPRRPEPTGDDRLRPRREPSRRDDDKPPATGKALWAWAGDRDLKKQLMALGKRWSLPQRIMDWSADEVRDAFDELSRDAPRPSAGNGYARARS